jgi:hypothetical protein
MYVVIPSTGTVLSLIPNADITPGIAEVYDVEYMTTVRVLNDIVKIMRERCHIGQLRGSDGSSSEKSISKFGSVVDAIDASVLADTPVVYRANVFVGLERIAWTVMPLSSRLECREDVSSSLDSSMECESYS